MGKARDILRWEIDWHVDITIIILWQTGWVTLPSHRCVHISDKRQFRFEWEDEWSWYFAASHVMLRQRGLQNLNLTRLILAIQHG